VIQLSVTIKQIADIAQVHRSTVDKVLHKRPGVSDEVRTKIQKIIDDLGYEVNPIGKALNSQKHKRVITAILLTVDALSDIRSGIEQACRNVEAFNIEVDFNILKYPDIDGQVRVMQECIQKGVDGIIITPLNHPKIWNCADAVAEAGIPLVTVNTDIKGEKRLCYIGQDAAKAGITAGRMMSLFLSHCGKVGIIVGSVRNLLSMNCREKGFRNYMHDHEPQIAIVQRVATHEQPRLAYERTKKLLQDHPDVDGLFVTCGNVKEICRAIHDDGREGMPVVCYERYPQIEELLQQGIVACTISSDLKNQGYEAVKTLCDCYLYGKKPVDHIYMDIGILLKENM
jgi:LacI family transcriptional regulator